ncbi:MAG: type II toxin-antitoxin system prevent-host-death family antitoxin [Sulfurimonas sp.]|nr:type II toxin-antitoxin system prevent-host-death family antitoxin [Sulfurimonas sp.]MBU3939587.1 type II toxin-antitoxin system prevent-host-death family antitoxin [bacterium]MBU4023980.1 type II toxin-antitoxin system prevent-host-death family antitoxin [bacterium]
MQAYKRDEMISVTDLLKGFKMTLEKLTSHQLEKVAVMKNNKPEAVILSVDEYERLQSKYYWNRLDEETYLTKAYESLTDTDSKTMSIEELDKKLGEIIGRHES